ncbi:enoyl-CoA hydratase/isomerase family protein [Comamonas odontotermitis]|uniref:enoyl-CoA hydratase/isomerase family protein n=1 Tax=Comamonas odontotermitis TaxID=379895 RepID=UPI001CC3C373|nr:enoyl-CoA hydratase/isomerase family protein [Comamonas odontotermitis]UBB16229.1 enoyl-CoA hydratase/isomerase family protein [Comamonas odontotermitis]
MAGQIRQEAWVAADGRVHAHIVRVVLSHPGKLNAMSRDMWRALRSVFESLQSNPDVRCIVIEGEGDAFCAGGDISEYERFRFAPDTLAAFHEGEVWTGLDAMLRCDIPVIAVIRGACMGAGVEIASCCDIRIAATNAKFGAPIAKLGFPMAPKEAALVASQVGAMKARQMLLEAAVFGADQMQAAGFVSRCMEPDLLAAHVAETAARVASLAPQAARLNKQTLRALTAGDMAAPTLAQPYAYADSAEHREGIAAFVAKRAPQF